MKDYGPWIHLSMSDMISSQSIAGGSFPDHPVMGFWSSGKSTRYSGSSLCILDRIVLALYSSFPDAIHRGTTLWASTSWTATEALTRLQISSFVLRTSRSGEKSVTSTDASQSRRNRGMVSAASPWRKTKRIPASVTTRLTSPDKFYPIAYPKEEEGNAEFGESILKFAQSPDHEPELPCVGAEEAVEQIEGDGDGRTGAVGEVDGVDQRPVVPGPLIPEHPIHHRSLLLPAAGQRRLLEHPDAAGRHEALQPGHPRPPTREEGFRDTRWRGRGRLQTPPPPPPSKGAR